MSDDRWLEFWRRHGRESQATDVQSQVLRTSNKVPISNEQWQLTLAEIDRRFPVGSEDDLLDLCCGNGLLTAHFAPVCRRVVALDISPDLLATLAARGFQNVSTQCMDLRDADFPEGMFSRILIYAGLQYIDHAEAVVLLRKACRWLRPGGVLFAGDIPDRLRLWSFYNTPERRKLYFDNLVAGRDVVGTWFDAHWLEYLSLSAGFASAERIDQHPNLIYAHFRFDLIARR
ncbi:MAG: class I SAM-dependent methyltransferase [Pseudomonadota bacterium]